MSKPAVLDGLAEGGTPMKELMLNSLSRLRVYIRSRKRVIIVDLGLPVIVLAYLFAHGCP